MKFKNPIRSLSTLCFLILFAVAITPRQVLHDWCKEHKHASVKHTHNDQTQLNESDYYCGYNTPVTTSPALVTSYCDFSITTFYSSFNSTIQKQTLYNVFLVYTTLRGPPMNAINQI